MYRRILILLLCAVWCTMSYGQGITVQNPNPTTAIVNRGTYIADSFVRVGVGPVSGGIPSWWNSLNTFNGALRVSASDSQLYWYYNGWKKASGGGGSGTVTSITSGVGLVSTPNPITTTGILRADTGRGVQQLVTGASLNKVRDSLQVNINGKMSYADTVSLSNRINSKQNFVDTNTYDATKSNLRDTAVALRGLIATKQNTLTLTTTGTSGVATLIGATLNIPNYTSTGADSAIFATNYRVDTAKANLRTSINTKWGITGNSGTTPGTNYIGTSDAQNLSVRANGLERLQVRTDARVNISSRIGTIGDSSFIIERNGTLFSEYNVNGGIRIGLSTALPGSGIAIGTNSINLGFLGMSLQGGYNEGAQSMAIGSGSISTGPQNVAIGKQAYAGLGGNSVALGTANRSNHMGVFITGDGTYDPTYFTSRKDFEFITHFTTGYHFQTGIMSTPAKYVDIDSQASVDAAFYKSHGLLPTVTLGAGAGTGASFTMTGTLSNYTLAITIGTSPSASATIATITGFPTSSVNMSPVWSGGNQTTEALNGSQRPFVSGSPTSHVITAGSAALIATGNYIFNVICIPKL